MSNLLILILAIPLVATALSLGTRTLFAELATVVSGVASLALAVTVAMWLKPLVSAMLSKL